MKNSLPVNLTSNTEQPDTPDPFLVRLITEYPSSFEFWVWIVVIAWAMPKVLRAIEDFFNKD